MDGSRRGSMSRRNVMRLLGLGTGVGLLSAVKPIEGAVGLVQGGGRGNAAAIPDNAVVRTVLKDVRPDSLGNGAVLFHEHLSVNFQRGKPQLGAATPPE